MRTDDARQLAEECLAATHPQRWRHVEGVAARAVQVRGRADDDPVVAAAWLHDVGYSPVLQDTGLHALDGAVFLAARGVEPLVVSLVAFHTGAEFEAEERGLLESLSHFDRPPQELLDALILCDLTVSPTGEDVAVPVRIDEIVARYPGAHPVHRAVLRSSGYLRACCERAAVLVSAEERGVSVF